MITDFQVSDDSYRYPWGVTPTTYYNCRGTIYDQLPVLFIVMVAVLSGLNGAFFCLFSVLFMFLELEIT